MNNSRKKTDQKLKVGRSYYMLLFSGRSNRICHGMLSCTRKNYSYAFSSAEVYKTFVESDMENAKLGQPLRVQIKNGILSFVVMFSSKKEAELSKEYLPKKVALLLIKETIDKDEVYIQELRKTMMVRMSMINDVIISNNPTEMASAIWKSRKENKNFFSY